MYPPLPPVLNPQVRSTSLHSGDPNHRSFVRGHALSGADQLAACAAQTGAGRGTAGPVKTIFGNNFPTRTLAQGLSMGLDGYTQSIHTITPTFCPETV